MVEHSPYHPKVEGLSPAADAGTGREKIEKNVLAFIQNKYCLLMIILRMIQGWLGYCTDKVSQW